MTLNLSYYKDGEARTTPTMNRPLQQLAAAVESLQSVSGAQGASGRVVAYGVPVYGAGVGDVVYLDGGVAKRAVAQWSTVPGDGGRVSLAASARPVGLIIAVNGSSADILVKGLCSDTGVIAAIDGLGEAGPHYLSGVTTDAGKVTSSRPLTAIHVLDKIDASTILVDIVVESPEQHVHQKYTLSASSEHWVEVDGEYVYTGEHADTFSLLPAVSAVIIVNGVVNGDYAIDATGGVATVRAPAAPDISDNIDLYLTIPYGIDLPVVRAIATSGSPRLRARDNNGVVTLSFDEAFSDDAIQAPAGTALHDYSPTGAPLITPVVSELTAGANISITKDNQGRHTISAGYAENTPVYPSFIDLNGVSAIGNGSEIYYYFPATAGKSITGVIPVLPPPSGVSYEVHPFVIASGKAAAFSGATFGYGLTHYPTPSEGAAPIPDAVTGSIAGVGVTRDYIAMFTATAVPLTTGGQVFLSITKTTSSAAYISGFGLIIVPKEVTP